jgi:predicted Zn-dependent peptidase
MLDTFVLSNGIKVATYNLPSLKSFYMRILNKGGSIVENKTNNGVAHFMEHLLVQGIPTLPTVEEFSGYIESLAGTYSAHTSRLMVGFDINVPAIHQEDAIKISSEVFFAPLFVEGAIEKERQAILEELATGMDSHWFKISEFFRQNRFTKDHPLTLDTGGTMSVVKKLTRQQMIDYWKKYFQPDNTYIVVSGNFEPAKLKELLEKYFSQYTDIHDGQVYPTMSNNDFSKRQVVVRSDAGLSVNYIDLSFPSLPLESEWHLRMMQNLAFVILGGIRNSRLFKLLRYQKGLVYDVSAGATVLPGIGYGYLNSEVSNAHLDQVIELMCKELVSFVKNGPTQQELDFVKNYLSNQWLMAFDHPSSIAGWIENGLLWHKKIMLPEEYIEVIKDVSVKDIVELISTYWDFSKMNLTIQGPLKTTKEHITKLEDLMCDL